MYPLINGKHTPRLAIAGGVLLFLLFPFRLFAQSENNNWLFDYKLGLNFNTSSPSFWGDTTLPANIKASISDRAGNLLFSTNTLEIYDRNFNVMPNSQVVGSSYSTGDRRDDRAVIIPNPDNSQQYYVVAICSADSVSDYNFAVYSIVDMSLNNGMGDVVPGKNRILLAGSVGASIAVSTMATPCSGYWIIMHKRNSSWYLSWNITTAGVSSVVHSLGLISPNLAWFRPDAMCYNNSTGRIVSCLNSGAENIAVLGYRRIETAVFNKNTGQLTDFKCLYTDSFSDISQAYNYYGYPILSPDGSKLYCTRHVYSPINNGNDFRNFEQFDLSLLPDTVAVANSRYILDFSSAQYGSRLGPDNKVYHIRAVDTSVITVINSPNAAGAACGYTPAAIPAPALATLPSQFINLHHFGSNVVFDRPADTVFNSITIDTNVCPIDTIMLAADTGYQSTLWSTGSMVGTETFTQSGTYWVSGIKNCTLYVDTIKLRFTLDTIAHAAIDTMLCFGANMVLQPAGIYQAYSWSNGSTGSSITVNQPGVYTLTSTSGCNAFTDTFKVHLPVDTMYTSAIQDTIICDHKAVTLQADTGCFSLWWSTGSSNVTAMFSNQGNYWLITNKGCATYVDSFYIDELNISLGNDTMLCDGDTLVLHMDAGSNVQYLWRDGSTLSAYPVTGGGVYAVTASKNSCVVRDTIHIDLIVPSLSILESDTTICKGEHIMLHTTASPESNFIWSTGTGGLSTETNGAGVYTVAATNMCGTFHDSVTVEEKDCPCIVFVPNAFSPNGDGRNDVFDVGLRCPFLSGYTLIIYNRYGQKVFETVQPDSGWNGWHNGNPADPGTYVYYLKYYDGQNAITKKGDLTLIR